MINFTISIFKAIKRLLYRVFSNKAYDDDDDDDRFGQDDFKYPLF